MGVPAAAEAYACTHLDFATLAARYALRIGITLLGAPSLLGTKRDRWIDAHRSAAGRGSCLG